MNNCIICNKEFQPNKFKPKQKCCSIICRNKLANKRNSEYKQQWALTNQIKVKESRSKWLENNAEKRKEASTR